MLIIKTSCKDKQEAEKIATALLKKRLIACAHFYPIESKYWWKGKLEKGKEYALEMKARGKSKEIIKEIETTHSYELPTIFMEKVKVSKKTAKWIKKELV